MRDVRISVRVEDLVVDAVDDPVQLVRVRADELVQPFAELRRLHLRRVALAHGVDDIGVVNAAAQHVDDVVEAGNADADQSPFVEAGEGQRPEPENALGGEVVDGERGGRLGGRAAGVDAFDGGGHQPPVPVAGGDYGGRKPQT